MQIKALSPTTIEQLLACEARAFGRLNLLDEDEWDEERGEGAATGTLAHNAAKIWYRPNPAWLKRIHAGEDFEELARKAAATRQQAGEDRDKLNAIEEVILKEGLAKHPFTDPGYVYRLAIEETAKGKFGCELPKEPESVSQGRVLFDQIMAHYNRDNLNIVFAERRYKGKLANGVPIHTILDLAIDRGDGRLELVDYKTGWITLSTEEMYNKHQVRMNLLAVMRYDPTLNRFPNKSFTYFWVRPGYETGPVSFTAEQILDYEHYLNYLYNHTKSVTEPKESVNRFCGSCARKLNCKAFRKMVSDGMSLEREMTPQEVANLTDEQAMEHHNKLSTQIKLLEASKKNVGKLLLGRMQNKQVGQIRGEEWKVTLQQNRADSYDVATVLSLLVLNKIDPSTVVDATRKRVEEVLGNNKDAMRLLSVTMRRGASAPFVSVRKLSKNDLKEMKKDPPDFRKKD